MYGHVVLFCCNGQDLDETVLDQTTYSSTARQYQNDVERGYWDKINSDDLIVGGRRSPYSLEMHGNRPLWLSIFRKDLMEFIEFAHQPMAHQTMAYHLAVYSLGGKEVVFFNVITIEFSYRLSVYVHEKQLSDNITSEHPETTTKQQ